MNATRHAMREAGALPLCAAAISAAKLQRKIGLTLPVIIDEVGDEGATGNQGGQ